MIFWGMFYIVSTSVIWGMLYFRTGGFWHRFEWCSQPMLISFCKYRPTAYRIHVVYSQSCSLKTGSKILLWACVDFIYCPPELHCLLGWSDEQKISANTYIHWTCRYNVQMSYIWQKVCPEVSQWHFVWNCPVWFCWCCKVNSWPGPTFSQLQDASSYNQLSFRGWNFSC